MHILAARALLYRRFSQSFDERAGFDKAPKTRILDFVSIARFSLRSDRVIWH